MSADCERTALEPEELIVALMSTGGPSALRSLDDAALHAAVLVAVRSGVPSFAHPALKGHGSDPLVGRRVTGLAAALRDLAASGALERRAPGWVLAPAVRKEWRRHQEALPPAVLADLRDVAAAWQARLVARRHRISLVGQRG